MAVQWNHTPAGALSISRGPLGACIHPSARFRAVLRVSLQRTVPACTCVRTFCCWSAPGGALFPTAVLLILPECAVAHPTLATPALTAGNSASNNPNFCCTRHTDRPVPAAPCLKSRMNTAVPTPQVASLRQVHCSIPPARNFFYPLIFSEGPDAPQFPINNRHLKQASKAGDVCAVTHIER